MKNYTITVNGNVYEVTVEEGSADAAAVAAPKAIAAPKTAPKAAPKATGSAGKVKVESPMPGKILGIKVKVGDAVKKGQVIMILEAMKMENEIVALEDGTIASINTSVGAAVEAGDLLASIN